MKLSRIRVERLPGISEGFVLEGLSGGINVIVGPNASGKTSLCRAIRALLYPSQRIDGAVWIEAEFSDHGGILHAVRQGGEVHWSRDGKAVEAPAVAEERLAGCYTVELADLLAAAVTDGEIAERVSLEMSGGYDVGKVLDELLSVRRNHGRTERERLRETNGQLAQREEEHRGIRRREDELEEFGERLQVAKEAQEDAAGCQRALDLLRATRDLREREKELASFPDAIRRLHGDELEQLAELRRKGKKARGRLEEADGAIAALGDALAESGLEDSDADLAMLAEPKERLEKLRDIEWRCHELEKALAKAEGRQADALEQLGGRKPDGVVRISPEALSQVEEDLDRKRAVESEIGAVESELGRLPAASPERGRTGRLATARGELLRWLAAPARRTTIELRLSVGLLSVVGLVAVAAAADLLHPAAALGALPLVAAAVAAFRIIGARASERKHARLRFLEAGVAEPAAWTSEGVRARLDQLDAELTEARAAEAGSARRGELESRLGELTSQRALADRELEALAGQVGFDPRRLDASFERWLRLVVDYDRARLEVVAHRAELNNERGHEERLRGGLVEFVARFGEAPPGGEPDATWLAARLERIEGRLRGRDHAREELGRQRTVRERAATEIESLDEELATLFARADVTVDDDRELERRLALLDPWKKAEQHVQAARGRVEQASTVLGDHPDLLALVARDDEQGLRRRLAAQKEVAASIESLTRRITEIRKDIADACSNDRLARARADRQRAADALRDCLEEEWVAAAGSVVLEQVAREHARESRPAVLVRAADWFSRFTRHGFRLEFEPEAGFSAYEEATGEHRRLEELSGGTRMQLLLAVRLAFALEAEGRREGLPFFLDEALTTTDPGRFDEVAAAIGVLASSNDRQVFYLTAQPTDVERWRRVVAEPPAVIDLAAVRRLTGAVSDTGDLALPERPSIPAPQGRSPEEYGVLVGVSRVRPFEPVASVHVFHLLRDDLDLLARLLAAGIERVGPLEGLLASRACEAFFDGPRRKDLGLRVAIVRAFAAAWREGRGRPLDRQALEAGGMSKRVVDRIEDLAGELGADAAKLVEVLAERSDPRAKNFHSRSLDRLREYFAREGYLDDRPRLDAGGIRLRVLSAVADALANGEIDRDFVLARIDDLLAAFPD